MNNPEYILLQGCISKDRKKQKETFHKYVRRFIAICERYTHSSEEAQDIVQDSFIIIFNKIESFTWQGEGSFERWMKRIVTNAAINWYRKNKKVSFSEIDEFDNPTEETDVIEIDEIQNLQPAHLIQYNIDENVINQCLENIPESFRIVFSMHVIDGYSHKEIAEMLGIPEKTSTTRLFRARRILQNNILCLIKEKKLDYAG